MGCFSYICKECGEPILSDSFHGQKVKLFLLDQSKVIASMEGDYDSYGTVFIDEEGVAPGDRDSVVWNPWDLEIKERWDENGTETWHSVCDLNFSSSHRDGIAAVHSNCWSGNTPVTQSEDDPGQGDPPTPNYFKEEIA